MGADDLKSGLSRKIRDRVSTTKPQRPSSPLPRSGTTRRVSSRSETLGDAYPTAPVLTVGFQAQWHLGRVETWERGDFPGFPSSSPMMAFGRADQSPAPGQASSEGFGAFPVAVLTLEKCSGLELIEGRPHVKLEVCSAVLGSWWQGARP